MSSATGPERAGDRKSLTHVRASAVTLSAAEALPRVQPSEAKPSAPPQRYERGQTLGEGGMGEVALYRDAVIGRVVALKKMHPHLAANPEYRARFVREAKVQGRLEHPSVVPVYDLGVGTDGAPFFTMRRVAGNSLEEIIAAQRDQWHDVPYEFSLARLLSIFKHVCQGVEYAHSRGIVHRDLKPGNIMVGFWGEVYVLDWGLAKTVVDRRKGGDAGGTTPRTAHGRLLGTPGYMPPEQCVDAQSADRRADVYALGAILFELLTLEPLHVGMSSQELLRSTQVGADARASERTPEREIAPELDAICVKATALQPKDRFPTVRAMLEAVEAFMEGARDVEQRRRMAARHCRAALSAEREGSESQRDFAIREAGRALALDPESKEAAGILMRMALKPPSTMPEPVRRAISAEDTLEAVMAAKTGIVVYGVMGVAAGMVAAFGQQGRATLLLSACALAVATGLCFRAVFDAHRIEHRYNVLGVSLAVSMAIALATPIAGPLVFLPQFAVAHAVSVSARSLGAFRWLHLAFVCLSILVPFALEWTGVISPMHYFENGQVRIKILDLGELSSLTPYMHLGFTVVVLMGASAILWRLDDNLANQRARLYQRLWHLRHLIPGAVWHRERSS